MQGVTSPGVDCLTSTHAIEFDWANEWREAIDQSLHYAMMSGKRAGIILLYKKETDIKYLARLKEEISRRNLDIDILTYNEISERSLAGYSTL